MIDQRLSGLRRIENLSREIESELIRARGIHPKPHSSPHEGWAILYEEVDELWDLVKDYPKRSDLVKMRTEAIQVAAMAMRFVLEVCDV